MVHSLRFGRRGWESSACGPAYSTLAEAGTLVVALPERRSPYAPAPTSSPPSKLRVRARAAEPGAARAGGLELSQAPVHLNRVGHCHVGMAVVRQVRWQGLIPETGCGRKPAQ